MMSLFSGMKISGGKHGKRESNLSVTVVKTDSKPSPRRGQDDVLACSAEPGISTSAFGFIRDTPLLPGSPSTEEESSLTLPATNTTESRIPSPAADPVPEARTKDVDFDIDLDLDFELDPLRPGLTQGTGQVIPGTDLEGIDFSKDIDLDSLLEECRIKTNAPACEKDNTKDNKAEQEGEQDRKCKHDSNTEKSLSECGGNDDDDSRGHVDKGQGVLRESKFRFIHVVDGCDDQGIEEVASRTVDVPSVVSGTKNPVDGGSSLYDIELDVSDTLDVLLESHAASELQLRLAEEALYEEMEHLGKEKLRAVYSLIKKQYKLEALQAAQSQAISDENYEQAENLTKECNSLEEDLRCIPQVTLTDAAVDIFSSRSIIQEKRKRQRSEWIQAIADLQDQQRAVVEKMKEGQSGDPGEQRLKLGMRKTELDRAMGHVLLDKNHVERREAQFWTRIDEKTANLREKRNELATQKRKVQDEIAVLEEQLERLRREEERLGCEVDAQEAAINEVKAEFSEEISIIEEEKSNVKHREDRLIKDKMALDEDEESLDAQEQAFEVALAREQGLMTRISNFGNTISALNLDKEEGKSDGVADFSINLEPSTDIKGLQGKVLSATEEMQSTSAKILSNKTRLLTLKKKVTDTEDHIVTLQEAKQFAVSMRKFGEAKRLTEEIKGKMEEGQAQQAEVEVVSEELKIQQTSLDTQQKRVIKLKMELGETERKWELELCEGARRMMAEITNRIEDQDSVKSTLSARKLDIEQQAYALLVGWLSVRHGLEMPPDIAAILEDFKDQDVLDSGVEMEENQQSKSTRSSAENKRCEVQQELQELEEILQRAIEAEDYDEAERIQEKIEHHQRQETDTR